jgi:uncharacterized protein
MGNKKRTVSIILITLMLASVSAISAFADEAIIKYTADNDNMVIIDDSAELLSEEERKNLFENMKAITEYGHAAFVTINYNENSAKTYANNRYAELFGEQSGTLFLIDMDNRMIQFYSDGSFARTITDAKSNEIATNTYKYASDKDYFGCANEAFS